MKDFPVKLNKTATAHVQMQVGEVNVTVEVSSAASTIDTTTDQLGTTFDFKLQDYPTVAAGASGVLNLGLLQPGVGSSGGIGAGSQHLSAASVHATTTSPLTALMTMTKP